MCCITDGTLTESNFSARSLEIVSRAGRALEAGVNLFQIREKQLEGRRLCELTSQVVQIAAGTRLKVIVNGRADVAAAAGADGVHLPGDGVPVKAVRSAFGSGSIIGASVHSAEEAVSAREDGADYVIFGPVFRTPGKGGPTGLDELTRVCDLLDGFPVIAVGGVTRANAEDVLSRGAAGWASIRFLNGLIDGREMAD